MWRLGPGAPGGPAADKPFKKIEHVSTVKRALFSPAGGYLATQSKDGQVRLWDANWREVKVGRQGDLPGAMTFSPNGLYLAVHASDESIVVFLTATGKEVGSVPQVVGASLLALTSDGKYLAAAIDGVNAVEDKTVWVWDVAAKQKAAHMEYNSFIHAIAFDPREHLLSVVTHDLAAQELWRIEDVLGEARSRIVQPSPDCKPSDQGHTR